MKYCQCETNVWGGKGIEAKSLKAMPHASHAKQNDTNHTAVVASASQNSWRLPGTSNGQRWTPTRSTARSTNTYEPRIHKHQCQLLQLNVAAVWLWLLPRTQRCYWCCCCCCCRHNVGPSFFFAFLCVCVCQPEVHINVTNEIMNVVVVLLLCCCCCCSVALIYYCCCLYFCCYCSCCWFCFSLFGTCYWPKHLRCFCCYCCCCHIC